MILVYCFAMYSQLLLASPRGIILTVNQDLFACNGVISWPVVLL